MRKEISVPMPDGSYQRFTIVQSSVMHPMLASRYPEIQTFVGQGIDDPTATARFDWTPKGFHAQILLAVACTGEYAAFHGGTKPQVMAAMVTTMNRVTGVYELIAGPWMKGSTNIPGDPSSTIVMVTNAGPHVLYRLGVESP